MAVLLLHITLGDPETLHGDLVGTLAPHQGGVLRFADLLAQRHVDRREERQNSHQQPPVGSPEKERLAHRAQLGIAQLDETDVLPEHLDLLLGHAASLHDIGVAPAALGIGRDLQFERTRAQRHVLHARRVEIAEFNGLDVVRAFGACDKGVFELAVAGNPGRRGVDRLGRLDVILLKRGGQRQLGCLHEREVARTRDLHRIGRRRIGCQPVGRQHRIHRKTAYGAAEAGRSARRQRFDRDVYPRALHLAGYVHEIVPAPEEGVEAAPALDDDLRHGGDLGRLDDERTGLLRIEQVLLGHERLVDFSVEGFAFAAGVLRIEFLRPEAVERREFHIVIPHYRNPLVEFEGHAQRLAFENRSPRHDGPQQDVVLGDPALRRTLGGGFLAALRLPAGGGTAASRRLALVHHLDRQRLGTVGSPLDRHLGRTDGDVPGALRHEHVGDRVVDNPRHRIVHDLDRLSLRFGRAGDHVEPFERRSFERARLGLRVQCELHAERLADSDRQRRISLKSDLLGSRCREDRQHEECRQGYFRNEISH